MHGFVFQVFIDARVIADLAIEMTERTGNPPGRTASGMIRTLLTDLRDAMIPEERRLMSQEDAENVLNSFGLSTKQSTLKRERMKARSITRNDTLLESIGYDRKPITMTPQSNLRKKITLSPVDKLSNDVDFGARRWESLTVEEKELLRQNRPPEWIARHENERQ